MAVLGDYQRSGVHRGRAGFNVYRAPLKECPAVFRAQVLHSFNSRRRRAPKDVRLTHDVGQILFARNTQNGISPAMSQAAFPCARQLCENALARPRERTEATKNESKEVFCALS